MEFLQSASLRREDLQIQLRQYLEFTRSQPKRVQFLEQTKNFSSVEKSVNSLIQNSNAKQRLLDQKLQQEFSSETQFQERDLNKSVEFSDFRRLQASQDSPIKNLLQARNQQQTVAQQLQFQQDDMDLQRQNLESLHNSVQHLTLGQPTNQNMSYTNVDRSPLLSTNLRTNPQVVQNTARPETLQNLQISSQIRRQQLQLQKAPEYKTPKLLNIEASIQRSNGVAHSQVQASYQKSFESQEPVQPQKQQVPAFKQQEQDVQSQKKEKIEQPRTEHSVIKLTQEVDRQARNYKKTDYLLQDSQTRKTTGDQNIVSQFGDKLQEIVNKSRFKQQDYERAEQDDSQQAIIQTDHSHLQNSQRREHQAEKEREFAAAMLRSQLAPMRHSEAVGELSASSLGVLEYMRGMNGI